MAVWISDELFGHDQDTDPGAVQHLLLCQMRRIGVDPFDKVLDLVNEGVVGRT